MKILLQSRANLFTTPGGDTIQLSKTKEYLEKLGIKVDVSLELRPNLDEYDLVHLFNITRVQETYLQVMNAKNQSKPIALSTIYWNMKESDRYARKFSIPKRFLGPLANSEYTKPYFQCFKDLITHQHLDEATRIQRRMSRSRQQIEVLKAADIILPNSYTEKELIVKDFKVDLNFVVVPNAVETHFAHASPKQFIDSYGLKNFILSVGNISIRKNQLNLIQALREVSIPLVIIGRPNTVERRFDQLCRRKAGKNVIFLGEIPHEELPSAYAAAKVHVLPSWYETPGLSNLEAGLANCNIVTTDRGSTKEYFKDYAWYCDPGNINSIRKAVLEAYNTEKNNKLREHILANYTWDKAAVKTLEAYKITLQGR